MHAGLEREYALITAGFLQSIGVDPEDPAVHYEDRSVLEMPARAIYTTTQDRQGDDSFAVLLMFTHSHYIYSYSLAMPPEYEATVRESMLDFINGVESFKVNFRQVPWPDTADIRKPFSPSPA